MKKKLALLVILSIFLTGFVPQRAILSQEYNSLICLFENQPILQYYFSLSTIPVTIVNRLFSDKLENKTPLPGTSKKQNTAPADTSAKFTFIASEKASGVNSHHRFSLSPHIPGQEMAITGTPFSLDQSLWGPVNRVFDGCLFLLLILLLFTMLPRGALDIITTLIARAHQGPIWHSFKSGFLFSGLTLSIQGVMP